MSLNIFKLFILLFIIFFFAACEKKVSAEISDVHWDRDMCDRCKMVVSEKNHAAQVINPNNGRVYKFDDIGCAILWFKEDNITWKEKAKIWIADIENSKWINAKIAYYDTLNITPMAYGFGAHEKKESIKEGLEIINFQEMSKRVLDMGR